MPKEIGRRMVVLDFSVDENNKPLAIDLVSSEAEGLNPWAKALVESGTWKVGSEGVVKIGDRKYRATFNFPLKDDGAPLPPNVTLPQRSAKY